MDDGTVRSAGRAASTRDLTVTASMQVNPIFLGELLIFNGAVLTWAFYEYWSVRKTKAEPESPPPDEPGHTEG